jgi:hypothetical protein
VAKFRLMILNVQIACRTDENVENMQRVIQEGTQRINDVALYVRKRMQMSVNK